VDANTEAIIRLAWSRILGLPDGALAERSAEVVTRHDEARVSYVRLWDHRVLIGPPWALTLAPALAEDDSGVVGALLTASAGHGGRLLGQAALSFADSYVPGAQLEAAVVTDDPAAVADLEARITGAVSSYVTGFDAFRPHEALAAVWDALFAGNEFLTRLAPWTLAHNPADRAAFDATIAASVTLLAKAAVLLGPVIPTKAEALWRALGGPGSVHDRRLADVERLDPTGWEVTAGTSLFPRAVIPSE
jgi:methionyl-tRNA synthetase